MKAFFAIPGDLNTPTGGYAYARRVLAEIGVAEVDLTPLPLPPGFPQVGEAEVSAALDALAGADAPVLLDALAGGALPGDALARLPVPVVMLCHHPLALETGMTPDDASRLRDSETAALAACRHVITASDTTAQILEADYAVPGDKLTVARPGTDPAPLAAGSGGPGLRIVSVGSLSRRKGHDLLISALAGVEQAWTLRIIGPALDPAYADQLRTQIEAQGLTDRVTLVGAWPPRRWSGSIIRPISSSSPRITKVSAWPLSKRWPAACRFWACHATRWPRRRWARPSWSRRSGLPRRSPT